MTKPLPVCSSSSFRARFLCSRGEACAGHRVGGRRRPGEGLRWCERGGGSMEGAPEGEAPAAALAAVLKHSSALPPDSAQVRGYDFNRGVDYRAVLEAFGTTGFQATNFGRAVHQINAMVRRGGASRAPGAWPLVAPTQCTSWRGRGLPERGVSLAGAAQWLERGGPYWGLEFVG